MKMYMRGKMIDVELDVPNGADLEKIQKRLFDKFHKTLEDEGATYANVEINIGIEKNQGKVKKKTKQART